MKMRAMALMLVVGGGAACNAISGAKEIDFTRAPETDEGSGGGGGGGGGDVGSSSSSSSGNSGAYTITCGPGGVAVGVYGRSGAWMDNLGLHCAPLHGDGTLGSPYITDPVGGNGGSPGQATCPMDQALVGIEIWTNEGPPLVYGINLLCQTIAEWKMPDATTNTVAGLGSASGTKSRLVCPHGFVLSKVAGQTGPTPGYNGTFVLKANFTCLKT